MAFRYGSLSKLTHCCQRDWREQGRDVILEVGYHGWVSVPGTHQGSGNQDWDTNSGQAGTHSFNQSTIFY